MEQDHYAQCLPEPLPRAAGAPSAGVSSLMAGGEQAKAAPIRVGIMGTPVSSGNRGVLALGCAIASLCLEAAPEVVVSFFGSHRDRQPFLMRLRGRQVEVPIVPWRLSPRCAWREHILVIVVLSLIYRWAGFSALRRRIAATIPWIKAVEESSMIGDVRGGDSFSDIYGLERFLMSTLPVLSVIAIKGSIVQLPQTYGPFRHPLARAVARFVLRRSSRIIARDKESQRAAQELAGPRQTVLLSPDVAFALHAECPREVQTEPPLEGGLPPGLVGLNVNGLMFSGGYTGQNMFGLELAYPAFLSELVVTLLAVHPGELLLVPHTIAPLHYKESDNAASLKLRASLPAALQARVRVVSAPYDAHELKGIIGQCELFIGSRMHACIAALSQGVPAIGVAYSRKFLGVFESVGMEEWVVDGRDTSNRAAVERILQLYPQRLEIRAALARRAAEARAGLTAVFHDLVVSRTAPELPPAVR